jgi:hypothetical protein
MNMNSTSRIRAGYFSAWLAIFLVSSTASGSTITGSVWENDPSGALNAIPGNVPSTAPDVTFSTTTPIQFVSDGLYTIGEFLSSGNGSTILSGSSQLSNTLGNTIFTFVGVVTVTTGEVFSARHDDGITLTIGGIPAISAPGPTAFELTTEVYAGPSGMLPFQLVYGECCSTPAALSFSLPFQTVTPEPSSFILTGVVVLGLISLKARRKLR